MDALQRRQSFDFDSIVWRTNAGGTWRDHIVISEAAFQAGVREDVGSARFKA